MTFNTQPLPYIPNIDNRIYEYSHDFLDSDYSLGSLKRAKSVKMSSQSLSASLSGKGNIFDTGSISNSSTSNFSNGNFITARSCSGSSTSTGNTSISTAQTSSSSSRSPSRSGKASPASLRYKRRLRIPQSTSLSNITDFATHFGFNSDSSFAGSYSSSNSDSSDLESLPDFTEDDGTPMTTPIKMKPGYFRLQNTENTRRQLHLDATPTIFDIPEIVHRIISFVDAQNTVILQEDTPIRRKPLSYKHALLIHGTRKAADQIMREQTTEISTDLDKYSSNGALHSCLLVNKLFHTITSEILNKKVMFHNESQVIQFTHSTSYKKPELIIFHKLFTTRQVVLDTMSSQSQAVCLDNLKWLQFYMCPKLYPPVGFLTTSLTKLIITGSKVVDDSFLAVVSVRCPKLEVLDIRACELVTDSGVYQIGKNCSGLTSINLGRKCKGNLITDHSLSKLITNNKQLATVGLAGCHITDKTIWDLAVHTSANLERLSLNNCPLITNHSIPLILARRSNYFFQCLSVLELRFNTQLTEFAPIVEFRRRQEYRGTPLLVEVCEPLMLKMRQQEIEMDKLISQRIFKDISDWVNEEDGDEPYRVLLDRR